MFEIVGLETIPLRESTDLHVTYTWCYAASSVVANTFREGCQQRRRGRDTRTILNHPRQMNALKSPSVRLVLSSLFLLFCVISSSPIWGVIIHRYLLGSVSFEVGNYWKYLGDEWAAWGSVLGTVLICDDVLSLKFQWLIKISVALAFASLYFALSIPAFFLTFLAWLSFTFQTTRTGLFIWTRRNFLLRLCFIIIGSFSFFSAAIGVFAGKRFYVVSTSNFNFIVGYKEAKLAGPPGDGDTGMRYLFIVGPAGLQRSRATVSRSSCTPFSSDELSPEDKQRGVESFEGYAEKQGSISDGGDCV